MKGCDIAKLRNPNGDFCLMRHPDNVKNNVRAPNPAHGYRAAAALLALAGVVHSFEPAEGRSIRRHSFDSAEGRSMRRHSRELERKGVEKAEAKKPPEGPVFAVVDLADQHVSFYDANGLWTRSQVATGVPGHPTPTGIFTILEKERWHRSNIYSGAPMPFMQRVTWTGVAMHAGVVPGHVPASHGCIRLHADFAKQMFALTKEGQRVVIAPHDVEPVDIVHAHLPVPMLQAPDFETLGSSHAADKGSKTAEPVALATQAASSPPLDPGAFAKAMKAAAAAKAAGAAKSKKAALGAIDGKQAEARSAAREVERAEEFVQRAQKELDETIRLAAKVQGEEPAQKAADKKAAAEAKLAEAGKTLSGLRDAKAAADRELAALQDAIRDADAAEIEAAALAKEAARRMQPVSIFISRKTGRLYVRQATAHLFETQIAIRDPGRPIGTHLFIATKPSEDGASLHWVSLTPPAAVEYKVRPHSSRRGRKFEPQPEASPVPAFPETAAGALDRIEIPSDALQRISALLWTGATLIVSDVEMSGEGRFAMDFMILGQTRVREE